MCEFCGCSKPVVELERAPGELRRKLEVRRDETDRRLEERRDEIERGHDEPALQNVTA